jgi:hypothetical protein
VLVVDLSKEPLETVQEMMLYDETFNYDDPENVWEKDYTELEPLQGYIEELAEYFLTTNCGRTPELLEFDGWCVTTPKSNTHMVKHHHRGHADVVVIYYPIVAEVGGAIEIYPADDNSPDPNTKCCVVVPFQGMMIAFPGDCYHRVLPYTGARLSIATNVKVVAL